MKLLLFIILLSSYSFAQNEIIRRTEFEDSLSNLRSAIGTGGSSTDTVIYGSATINVGADSVIVTHGIGSAPSINNIGLQAQGFLKGSSLKVTDITSTTFKIKLDTSIVLEELTSPLSISWFIFNAELAQVIGNDYTTPEIYGAVANGSTSDVDAINTAIETGKPVKFASGSTYAIDTAITLQSNTHLIGYGATIDGSNMDASEWRFMELGAEPNYGGTATYKALLTADANIGDYTIYTDTTTGISVGDFIRVRSGAYLDGANTYRVAEIAMVYAKTDTSITLDRGLFRQYLTSDNAVYDVMSLVENVIIEGFTFLGSSTVDADMNGFYFKMGRNIVIRNCTFKYIDRTAVSFYDVIDSKIENCRFLDIRDNGNGYGIGLSGACEGIMVANNFSRNVKRLMAIGGSIYGSPINVLVQNNIIYSRSGGIDSHGGSIGFNIVGNNIISEYNQTDETRTSITIRGGSFSIIGNTIYNIARDSIVNSDAIAITNTSKNAWGGNITNNTIYGGNEDNEPFGTGISIYPTTLNNIDEIGVSIAENYLHDCKIGIYIIPNANYLTNARYTVSKNQIYGFYDSGIKLQYVSKSFIAENYLKGDTASTSNLYGLYITQSDNAEILNNQIEMTDYGIRDVNSDSIRIKNNRLTDITYGFYPDTASHDNIIEDNYFKNVTNFKTGSFAADVIIKQNEGYVTNNNGVDTLEIGFISTVSHGLDITPEAKNIFISPHTNLGGFSYWFDNITSTTFDINIQEDTSLISTEMVNNGTFDDSTDWTFVGALGWTVDGGVAICDSTDENIHQDIGAVEDSVYRVSFTWTKTQGNLYVGINDGDYQTISESGSYVLSITAGATSDGIKFAGSHVPQSNYTIGILDNVSVKQVSTNGDKIFSWQIKD